MPREAERVQPGQRSISATRTLNPVIESANKVAKLQGGTGIASQNDITGLQLIARASQKSTQRPDGDTPFTFSSPLRRTLKRRTDATRHRGEWELYNSSTVSARGIAPTSGAPPVYGVPFLPVSSSGSGDMLWGVMDADEFGATGPRSLELRSSSSGERFQVFAFDDAAATLTSSETVQVCVRRAFGAGAHYVAWVNSSDVSGSTPLSDATPLMGSATGEAGVGTSATRSNHRHPLPRWELIQHASTSVRMLPDTDASHYLRVGFMDEVDSSNSRLWSGMRFAVANNGTIEFSAGQNGSLPPYTGGVIRIRQGGTNTIEIDGADGLISISASTGLQFNALRTSPSATLLWLSSSGYLRIG